MMQDDDRGSIETISDQPIAGNSSRQVAVDVRSRDAFELLRLGEAIVNLQSDLRNLRLEKEELRFERNRYQASAVQYQEKLSRALDELDHARSHFDETKRIRREVVDLAREFAERLEFERNKVSDHKLELLMLQQEMEMLKTSYEDHQQNELSALRSDLKAEYDNRLRHEIVSLSRECAAKLVQQAEAIRHNRAEQATTV